MREAYLTGGEPVFTRTGPLSRKEQQLLEQAQEPINKARYSYYDCEVHGIFQVDNELGLAEIDCPRRGKCRVREVFDPAGYVEYYGMDNPKYHSDPAPAPAPHLTPDPSQKLGQVLDAGGAPAMHPEVLRQRLEQILGVSITAGPEQLLEALREGLICMDDNRTKRPADLEPEPEEPAGPELTDIEHYASLQFSAAEVCTMLGLDYQQQLRSPEFQQQMLRGKLMQQAQLRETIFLHAKNGSAPAQVEALKLIRQAEINAAGHND